MPRRKCVGCGRVAPKPELVRLALAGDRRQRVAVLDRAGVLPGRGAYLCRERAADIGREPAADSQQADSGREAGLPTPACLKLAERRGGVARALRCKVKLDPELVESIGA